MPAMKVSGLKLYKMQGRDQHDPMIDQMRTLFDDEDLSYKQVHEISGLSTTTLNNWFNRARRPGTKRKPTMRPQFASVMSFVRAFGRDLQIVKASVSPDTGVRFQRNIRAKSNSNNAPAQQ